MITTSNRPVSGRCFDKELIVTCGVLNSNFSSAHPSRMGLARRGSLIVSLIPPCTAPSGGACKGCESGGGRYVSGWAWGVPALRG